MDYIYKFFHKYVNKYLSTKIVFVLDTLVSIFASLCALVFLNIFIDFDLITYKSVLSYLCIAFVVTVFLILILKTYRIIIRHSTLGQTGKLVVLAFLKSSILVAAYGGLYSFGNYIYFLLTIDFLFTIILFLLIRIAMIFVYEMVMAKANERKSLLNVMIYGIGYSSVSLVSRLQQSNNYNVVGFVLPGQHINNHNIASKSVCYVDSEASFIQLKHEYDVDAILFATEDEARKESDTIIKYALDNGVKTLLAPSIGEMPGGKLLHTLRNIEIEDLLMRSEIKVAMEKNIENFKGKTVMVTGAAGSIGSELCRQLSSCGVKELILFDNAETPMHNLRLELEENFPQLKFIPLIGDVRQRSRLDFAFRNWKPQVVFHAAAYKHVPLMEDNPCEAVLVNVIGSRNVTDKCLEYGVEKMVMVSTDKAVNPTNVMGCTKRLAEIYVQALGLAVEQGKVPGKTKFVTTRFGNVLGSNGSVIPRFRDQIAKGGPVTVTHPDITRFFMTIPEACRLVMEAAAMTDGNQIFIFDMGESVKIDTLARRMIRLAGFTPDKDIAIEYSGLRPGEKLYEEVLSNKENTIPTGHSRIKIAKVREYEYSHACEVVDALEGFSNDVNVPDMIRLMKEIVPEFVSKNSRYEAYDK